jgi:hypothetical protein
MPRIDARCGRNAHRGQAEGRGLAAVAWRVGWIGSGRAAGVARVVGRGVAADRTGPDRVGSRGAAATRGDAARPADGVRPRQRPLGIPPDPRRRRAGVGP